MKSTEKWFGELLDSYKDDFEFRLETLLFELTEQISKKLEENKMSRKQFAEKLGISPAAVSKVLNGNPNFTIRTLLLMADALKIQLNIEFRDKLPTVTEVKCPTTASDVAMPDAAPELLLPDLASAPPPWMLPKTTSACNNL